MTTVCPRCQIVPRPKSGGLCPTCKIDARSGATMASRGVPSDRVPVNRGGVVRWEPKAEQVADVRQERLRAVVAAVYSNPICCIRSICAKHQRAWMEAAERQANLDSYRRAS